MSRIDFNSPLELRMQDIYENPDEYLSVDACEPGVIYWGNAAKIGQVAVCRGIDHEGRMLATGIEEERGVYRLVDEIHQDQLAEHRKGTWMPHVAIGRMDEVLGRIPFSADEPKQKVEWVDESTLFDMLLAVEIEVTEEKIAWLMGLPSSLRATQNHADYLDLNNANLRTLLKVQKYGRSALRLPTTAEVLLLNQEKAMKNAGIS